MTIMMMAVNVMTTMMMTMNMTTIMMMMVIMMMLLTDRVVLVGNHYDAIAYGAVDPGSGTAVLLEMARAFSNLTASGRLSTSTIFNSIQ
jgi:hypothetical protein